METPGTILRRARETRGYTLQDLSTVTRIPLVSLGHLENDAFDELPAEVFVRGFLRNIARELGLAGEAVIESYEAQTGRSHRSPMSRVASIPVPEIPSLASMPAPSLVEALPKARLLKMPNFDRVVEVVGSARPTYVIGTLLLLGLALTVSVLANGTGAGPNLSLNNAPPTKASWNLKADGDTSAPWIVKGQTSNLAGAATLDLSRPKKAAKQTLD